MSSNKKSKANFFREFLSELGLMLGDIFFMYRNFFHWNFSKILIFVWILILAIIVTFPLIVVAIIIGFIDPINWNEIVAYGLGVNELSLELVSSVSQYPVWVSLMMFLGILYIISFFFVASYYFFLLSRLSLKYIDRKKLSFKKNTYFSQKHIRKYLLLISRAFLYILVPLFVGMGYLTLLYVGNIGGFIPLQIFQFLTVIGILIIGACILYIFYKRVFSIIILADQKKKEKIFKTKHYIKESGTLTTWRNFAKILFIIALYGILMSPFKNYEVYLENRLESMASTLAYKAGQVSPIDEKEQAYLEYVSSLYEDMSGIELEENIVALLRLRLMYAILMYFVFGGLFIMLLASFYRRVLIQQQ